MAVEHYLGKRSLRELAGPPAVDPILVALAHRVCERAPFDVGVHDGARSESEQAAMLARKASRAMRSKHQDGKAIDLVPWIGGRFVWDWPRVLVVINLARDVARALSARRLVCGAVWDRPLIEWSEPSEVEIQRYAQRRKGAGKDAFIDAVHYQIQPPDHG